MKIVIFLVLSGLSLAEEIKCPKPPTPKDKEQCLSEALNKLSDFTKSYTKYMCEYRGKFEYNKENHDKAARDTFTALVCAGCKADYFLDTNKTFEELLLDIGKFGAEVLIIAEKIADILGLTEDLFTVICGLAGDALASKCTEWILKDNTPALIESLDKLFCKDDPNALSEDEMIDLLINMGCIGDKTLHTNDLLEKFLKGLGEDLRPGLIKLLNILKELLIQKGLASKFTCDLTKILLGEKPIIDLGGLGH